MDNKHNVMIYDSVNKKWEIMKLRAEWQGKSMAENLSKFQAETISSMAKHLSETHIKTRIIKSN
jgi:hypothetical protein